MKALCAGLLSLLAVMPVSAEDASNLLQRVLSRRPPKDIVLKARLFQTREKFVPVEIIIQNRPAETRTIYRSGATELLVIQPVQDEPRYFLKGTGELTGNARLGRLLDSNFVYYDLGLPFLQWPAAKLTGDERLRGRDCFVVEVTATNKPYARVKLWLDKEYIALLKAEGFNENGDPVRRFSVLSFRKVDEVWVPSGLESAIVPAGQALPAQERSRLEVFDGNYDAKLPAAGFDPARFAAPGQ